MTDERLENLHTKGGLATRVPVQDPQLGIDSHKLWTSVNNATLATRPDVTLAHATLQSK